VSEQIALKFPDGTRERIKALAPGGETQTAVILRALAVLECGGIEPESPAAPAHDADRLAAMEARIAAVESSLAPAPETRASGDEYPASARYLALGMRACGCRPDEIRAALLKACGRTPAAKHLARALRRWQG
jgi:hypothetical protein